MERHRMTISGVYSMFIPAMLAVFSALIFPVRANAGDNGDLCLKTVVIDPGHGGKDAGCVSKDRRTYEKNLTLSIAKLLGSKIKAAYPDVKVIYTRTTDTYITLNDRAETANRNNANLFISIHVNAVSSTSPHGFSTHVLGQSRDKNRDLFSYNMDVCRRENAVIMLEDDYSTKYQGFDPNDPESFIFFNLMQNAFYEQSLLFAAEVDSQLSKGPISHSRGVWQDPFLVLWKTKMPSVLIEVGFISNASDLKIMNSSSGREEIAQKLFNAFSSFKKKYDGSLDYAAAPSAPQQKAAQQDEKPAPVRGAGETGYGVQILVLSKKLPEGDRSFKGTSPVAIPSGNLYKYVVKCQSADAARNLHKELKRKFPDSFPVQINGNDVKRLSK